MAALTVAGREETRRFFFINRASGGLFRRNTMASFSERLRRLNAAALTDPSIELKLVPVSVFWGRAPRQEKSLIRMLLSESWEVTSGLRRLLGLFINRSRILVHFGKPVPLGELLQHVDGENVALRRVARVARIAFRNHRVAALGPDFSHLRTLVEQITSSRRVSAVIDQQVARGAKRPQQLRKAHRHAIAIASNMSYTPIRLMERVLSWFWNQIYSGIDVHGIEQLQRYVETHTVVLTPSHRSHIDYLVLSYVLFQKGLMIPHIAAGDNLDLPLVGGLLRRCGAFFMRRSFRDDPLYFAVFSEYLYEVLRRGHSIEYFIEGGRSRTGRVLPAKTGMLQMTLEHHERGVPRPLVFVPVYFGYEKVIEASSYLDELKGSKKRRESLGLVVSSLRLIKRNYGRVAVNFGEPLLLSDFIAGHPPPAQTASRRVQATALGDELLTRINGAANVNAINLVAMVMLTMPKLAMEETMLAAELRCFRALLEDSGHALPSGSDLELIAQSEALDFLERESGAGGEIMTLTPKKAVLGTWYRNNVMHTLLVPALIAALLSNRQRPLTQRALIQMVEVIYPYLRHELKAAKNPRASWWITRMSALGLLNRRADGSLTAPSAYAEAQHHVRTLALLVKPILERYYLVIGLLTQRPGEFNATSLTRQCETVARRLSRLYGLNAPEFFDRRLFNQFIDLLIRRGTVTTDQDQRLSPSPLLRDIARRAEGIIDGEFRAAVFRSAHKENPHADAPAHGRQQAASLS